MPLNPPKIPQVMGPSSNLDDPPQILLILFYDEACRKPLLRARAGLPNEARVPFVNCLGLPERNRRYGLGGRMSNWGGMLRALGIPSASCQDANEQISKVTASVQLPSGWHS